MRDLALLELGNLSGEVASPGHDVLEFIAFTKDRSGWSTRFSPQKLAQLAEAFDSLSKKLCVTLEHIRAVHTVNPAWATTPTSPACAQDIDAIRVKFMTKVGTYPEYAGWLSNDKFCDEATDWMVHGFGEMVYGEAIERIYAPTGPRLAGGTGI